MKECKICGYFPINYQVIDLTGESKDLYYYKCPKCSRTTNYYETEQEAAQEWELINDLSEFYNNLRACEDCGKQPNLLIDDVSQNGVERRLYSYHCECHGTYVFGSQREAAYFWNEKGYKTITDEKIKED